MDGDRQRGGVRHDPGAGDGGNAWRIVMGWTGRSVSSAEALAKGDSQDRPPWVSAGEGRGIRKGVRPDDGDPGKGGRRRAGRMLLLRDAGRIHREGEGAPYTGLKPAGRISSGDPAADRRWSPATPARC